MAYHMMRDLWSRVVGSPQITTDGLPWYTDAVDRYFGIDCHYAQLQKHHGTKGSTEPSGRYSPAKLTSNELHRKAESDDAHVDAPFHAADERIQ